MRALVVGAGSIGQRHMDSLRTLATGVEFDVFTRAGRSRRQDDHRITDYSNSLEEAMSKSPDLMIIANPSALHLPFILAAIENRVPFYIEKPVVTKLDELQVLKEIIRDRSLPPNIVGCNLRFLPSLAMLRDLVRNGELGRIVRASFEAGQWLPDWRPDQDYRESYSASRELGGGVTLDLIHETDAAFWLMGDFQKSVAFTTRASRLEIETEDCACMLLAQNGGAIATVQLDYVSRAPYRKYRIVGDEATAEWDLIRQTLTVAYPEGERKVETTEEDFAVGSTYLAAMKDLLDAIERRGSTSQPIEEGVKVLDLILQASREGL